MTSTMEHPRASRVPVAAAILKAKPSPVVFPMQPEPMLCMGFHKWYHKNTSKIAKINGSLATSSKSDATSSADAATTQSNAKHRDLIVPYEPLPVVDFEPNLKASVGSKSRDFFKAWETMVTFDLPTNLVPLAGKESELEKCFAKACKHMQTLQSPKAAPKGSASLYLAATPLADVSQVFGQAYLEQETFLALLESVARALAAQKVGDSMVVRIHDTFTRPSFKLLCLLSALYGEVWQFKPLTSRDMDAERFLVCHKLKTKYELPVPKAADGYVHDLFPDYEPEPEMVTYNRAACVAYGNMQALQINEVMAYIRGGNYFGSQYKEYLKRQQDSHAVWLDRFWSDAKMTAIKKEAQAELAKTIKGFSEYLAKNFADVPIS